MLKTLTTQDFWGMIKNGALLVNAAEQELNDLNVFPVADKDTGTNLASLMNYLANTIRPADDWAALLHQIAEGALFSGCGNSGLIFSQFFYGLTFEKDIGPALLPEPFCRMIHYGVTEAFQAVSEPKEGTILTVMRVFDETLGREKEKQEDFVGLLKASLDECLQALKKTEDQLEVLHRYQVVDAGALGFCRFVEGMLAFLEASHDKRAQILDSQSNEINSSVVEHQIVEEAPQFRYCFETVLEGANFDEAAIRAKIAFYGDSLVLARGPKLLRIHVHTSDPIGLTRELSAFGQIRYQKIDDMQRQFALSQHAHPKIGLITDTTADLPAMLVEKHGIHYFPIQIKMNGHHFLDKLSIGAPSAKAIIEQSEGRISTAAPASQSVMRTLKLLSHYYESLIIVCMSHNLSSTHDVIANAVKQFKAKKISIIDSHALTNAQGMLTLYAAKLIEKGMMHDTIFDKLLEMRAKTEVFVIVGKLDNLVRSGRLPRSAAWLAKLRFLRPIIHLDKEGRAGFIGLAFSEKGAIKKVIRLAKEAVMQNHLKSFSIVHAFGEPLAKKVAAAAKAGLGIPQAYFTGECSSASFIQCGEGCVALSVSAIAPDVGYG